MRKFLIPLLGLLVGVMWGSTRTRAATVIADQGRSDYTIVVAADAPRSVQAAAEELQKDIELASGAKLTIAKDAASVKGPFISLGQTQQAKAAGLSAQKIGEEGFRILTKDGNLYILGPDTPDGRWTPNGGVSNGTANGVYTFLEKRLNVRWLMPGDLGRDVPRAGKLAIDDIDRTHVPAFSYRDLTHLKDGQDKSAQTVINAWMAHQRLGTSWDLNYMHNFWRALGGSASPGGSPQIEKLYKEHQDWFAMNEEGKRPYPKNHYAKLETTNPGLVKYFAERAIESLKSAKRPGTYSLAPSDGSGWSESPESKALYDPIPNFSKTAGDSETPQGKPSMSSLILKWYHDVARIVEKEYPQGRLAGLIYSSYVYPPVKYQMKLPENFTPVICGIGEYGYGLYRQSNVERYNLIMDAWAKVAPTNWFYYGLPNQLLRQMPADIGNANYHGSTAIVTPAAPDILNIVWDNMRRNHMKGADIYGVPAWSNSAMSNYIIARMMWNPNLDAYDVQKEWLNRAYGEKAGAVMRQFYKELNGWFRDWYQDHDNNYKLSQQMLKELYAGHYPEMERLYLEAQSQPMTEVQKQRLQLIGDNLIVLQRRLRNGGLWPAGQKSQLERSNEQVIPMLTKSVSGFELFPGIVDGHLSTDNRHRARMTAAALENVKVKLDHGSAPADAKTPDLDENVILIHAAKAGPIHITVEMVNHGAYFGSYQISDSYRAFFFGGRRLASGVLNEKTPITFNAKANKTYYLYLPPRKPVRYKLKIDGAATAEAALADKTLTLYSRSSAPVYVYYHTNRAPIGIFDQDGSVLIQKPFSAGAARSILLRLNHYNDVKILQSLDEGWQFSPDPRDQLEKQGVTNLDFNDSAWATISSLNWWQSQGFPDYHGPAWYRKTFDAKTLEKGHTALFYFGAIDGNAEVYLNGKKIKTHTLGEKFKGWNKPFFALSNDLKPGKNILAVKVVSKNDTTASGMFKGVSLLSGVRK